MLDKNPKPSCWKTSLEWNAVDAADAGAVDADAARNVGCDRCAGLSVVDAVQLGEHAGDRDSIRRYGCTERCHCFQTAVDVAACCSRLGTRELRRGPSRGSLIRCCCPG